MPKHCWICKNTEDFFLKQKEELLQSIIQEMEECEQFEKSIVDMTKEKLGFTDDSKQKVQAIQKVYTEMTLSAVLENKDNFIKLEPNLEIILDYCLKYGKRNLKTVNDVINCYLSEPVEERYAAELRQNTAKRTALFQRKAKLDSIQTFFVEKEITPHNLDAEIKKLKRTPVDYDNNRNSFLSRQNIPKQEKVATFSYSDLGFDFSKKICICPVCMSLLAEAANASFDIVEAQRKAQHDAEMQADWDDDDDWDDEEW